MSDKTILFLSVSDFTERGMQVILRTPGHLSEHGWDVHFLVARDTSPTGSFYYQKEINPPGIKTHRFEMPLVGWMESIKNHTLKTIYSKFRGYGAIFKLAYHGRKILDGNDVDVIYGLGTHGVLAAQLLRVLGCTKKQKFVSRFFGTFLADHLIKRNVLKIVLNWEEAVALYLESDLCIMTDDGSFGDQALELLASRALKNFKFWINGVDKFNLGGAEHFAGDTGKIRLLTICRLASWKRVERGIEVVRQLVGKFGVTDLVYNIVGDGPERQKLEGLSAGYGLGNQVRFLGALANDKALRYLCGSDIYISTYDITNVGNPLLEAIRAHKIIFTLNNGDTPRWIQHRVNGFIYDLDDDLAERMAKDIVEVCGNSDLKSAVIKNIVKTENEKLWTWEQRLAAELAEIEKILPAAADQDAGRR